MCEANVFLLEPDGEELLLLDAVDKVVPLEQDKIYLENIYGERKTVRARIKEMHLVEHRIILE
ncbi:MAG: CooT family nickel-binding protein [Clostridiales bacterium]|jgi:predicted RNA-binding protein|nr:CooT family nickel-binding protein [Clostridiales bacterium]